MKRTLIATLLAGVVMPFAAYAQDAQQQNQQPPAATATQTPGIADGSAGGDTAAQPSGASGSGDMAPAGDTAASDTGSTDQPATAQSSGGNDAGTMAADKQSKPTAADAGGSSDMAAADTGGANGPFVTVQPQGAWRASDLDGKDVYDPNGENIGSISDVIVSENGKVMAVLVGVGGFLGIGEKDVAVSMSALKFGPGKTEGLPTEQEQEQQQAAAQPAAGTAGTAASGANGLGASGAAGSGGTEQASNQPPKPVVGKDNLPDKIVLNVTRDQLENAPAYGESQNQNGDNTMATSSTGAGGGMGADTAPAAGSGSSTQ